ncbi:hypothetical protein AAU61_14185 [Desulfocarbo indianensis]|nr:hypothetical protein AAU61_14185 [Desulfocarbo indianensis]
MGDDSQLKINEAQLILAEKRTSLAALRTGLALLGLPMALVSFLVAMSGHYQAENVLAFLVPLLIICLALASLGVYLCWRAVLHLHRADARLARLKNFSQEIKEDLD